MPAVVVRQDRRSGDLLGQVKVVMKKRKKEADKRRDNEVLYMYDGRCVHDERFMKDVVNSHV